MTAFPCTSETRQFGKRCRCSLEAWHDGPHQYAEVKEDPTPALTGILVCTHQGTARMLCESLKGQWLAPRYANDKIQAAMISRQAVGLALPGWEPEQLTATVKKLASEGKVIIIYASSTELGKHPLLPQHTAFEIRM